LTSAGYAVTARHWMAQFKARPWWVDMLFLSAMWGSSFMFTKVVAKDIGPMAAAFGRVFIAFSMLLPLLAWRGHLPVLKQHWRRVLILGVTNSGIPFAAYCIAMLTVPSSTGAIVNAATPLFGALIAWIWLKEHLTLNQMIGLAVGFVGVSFLALQNATEAPVAERQAYLVGILVCIAAPIFYGISASYTKLYFSGVPPIVSATGSQLGATLFLAPFAWAYWPDHGLQPGTLAALLILGVFCTGLAYILFFRVIALVGASKALSVTFAVPVFAAFYGVTFLDEAITLTMFVCALVILLGISLSTGVFKLFRS
jgi:drug/metabolite transporter (DMT)-like permease